MAVYTTIDNPELYFQVKTYTGNGSTQSITFDGSEDMQPDLLWVKGRSVAEGHYIQDSVRGVTKHLHTQNTDAEVTDTGVVTALNSNGFSLGDEGDVNSSSGTFVAWGWKESATAGFDIVTYTGNGSARTISHSLSAVPKMFIIKNRSASSGDRGWGVYHVSNGNTHFLELNLNAAKDESSGLFNDTTPTSSVFSVGDNSRVNTNTETYVAYLFAEKQGYSKFGSFTGNGNADGTFIYTGFRPAMIIIKRTDATDHWLIYDDQRGYNGDIASLRPNENHSESTASGYEIDILSNGFKARQNHNDINGSGNSYVYMAFAKQPFVNSNGVPCNAR